MLKGGTAKAIYHGYVAGLTLEDRNTMGAGARVAAVRAGSTAEKAGFRRGDLVVRVNGTKVFNRERYFAAVGNWPEGSEIAVRVDREGEAEELKVVLDPMNKTTILEAFGAPMPARPSPVRPPGSGYLGAYIEESKDGLKVGDVTPDSPADAAGLQKGDVLLRINNRKLADRNELNARVWQRRPGDRVTFTILRDGKETALEIVLGKHPDDK
jgi:S1-C subfamily serine protease